MSKHVTIRPAELSDAERLQRYVAELFAERLPVLFRRDVAPTVDEERRFITQMQELPRSIIIVAVVDKDIVGMLDFHGDQRPQRLHAGEFGMSVSKAWRGRGIGARLLDYLQAWAKSEGIRRVELQVMGNNPAAIALYEKAGFTIEGRQVDSVEVDGAYVDVFLMAKFI